MAGTAPAIFSGSAGCGCDIADASQKPYVTSHGAEAAAKVTARGVGGITWATPGGHSGPAALRCEIADAPQKPHAEPATGRLTRWSAGAGSAGVGSAGAGGVLRVMAAVGGDMTELDRREQDRMLRGVVWPPTGGLRARLLGGTSLDGSPHSVMVYGGLPALIEAIEAGGDVWAAIARLCGKGQA
jgi:hypothetical protein